MNQKVWFFPAILFCLTLLFSARVEAGGGPLRLESDANTGTLGKPLAVRAYLNEGQKFTTPQNVQIKIRNQRSSDNCTTQTTLINDQNMVSAQCSSTQEGSLEIYAEWTEGGANSTPLFLTYKREDSSVKVIQPLDTNPTTLPLSPTASPSAVILTPVVTPTQVTTPKTISDENQPTSTSMIFPILLGCIAFLFFCCAFLQRKTTGLLKVFLLTGGTLIMLSSLGLYFWQKLEPQTKNPTQLLGVDKSLPTSLTSPTIQPLPAFTPTPTIPQPSPTSAVHDIQVKLIGEVIEDQNCNYQKDPGEPGLADISVPIYAFDPERGSQLLTTIKTDQQGVFSYTQTLKSNQQTKIQAQVYANNYGMNNFPQMPGAVVLSIKKPIIKQLFPLYKVQGGNCQQN